MPPGTPFNVRSFRDDDRGFFNWLRDNPDGYFVNSERNPRSSYLVLHRVGCPHFTGNPALHWTKDYIKHCASNRRDLEQWAHDRTGGNVTPCPTCLG
jgi:hypothetical protein